MRCFTRNNVLAFASCAALLFSACGDDSKNAGGSVEDQEIIAISDKTVTGVSQKGPFVNGSSVTVQELNGETLAQTGLGFEGKIKNDMGEFSVKVNKLESQYALLKANGFYRNEVTGEKSKSQVTLYALTDLSKRDEVNVNLLTHLAYERSLYLATEEDDVSVAEAKKQAETEVLKSFEIEGEFGDAEDLNIFGESDQSAALLAVSVLMQGNLSEGDFSERLANYAADIESDGVWNDTKTATQIADWAITQSMSGGLALIRNNIAGWNLSTGVPAFEKYVDNFWWQNYGLGKCTDKREGEVLKNQNAGSVNADRYFICKSNLWYVATALEYDTYEWKDGKDGDVKNGDVVKENCYVFEDSSWRTGDKKDCSLKLRGCTKLRQDTVGLGEDKVWYICDARAWRNATDIEKDTFGWKDSTDGAIKKGNVTVSIYVFDKTKWRATSDVEAKLGGCVSAIADSVGKVGSTYYICRSNKWVEASAIEYDTYRWTAGKDGDSKVGSVNAKNCYVYENSVWRSGNANDCSLELRGCTKNRQDTVGLGEDKVWYICDAKSWREAINIEKDTATWGAGKKDGEVRTGQVNKDVYYIYDAGEKTWRNATTIEKDTYDWKDSTDGAIKKGNVTDTIYVFDAKVWRAADEVESLLGGCFAAINDSVGKVGATYFICKSNEWVKASLIEYDTYRWVAGKDGEVRPGQVNANVYYIYEEDNKTWRDATTYEKDTYGWKREENPIVKKGNVTDTFYVYEDNVFRIANEREVYIKEGCTGYNEDAINLTSDTSDYVCKQGKWEVKKNVLVDSRDNQPYEIVRIGTQVWMAQNLNYADSIAMENLKGASWCGWGYESCDYRFYAWSGAMNVSPEYQAKAYGQESVQGVCPEGWHLPSREEWSQLIEFVGGPIQAWYTLTYDGEYGLNATYTEGGSKRDLSCEEDSWSECCEQTHDAYCVNKDKIGFWRSGGGFWWTSSEEDAVKAFIMHFAISVDGDGDGGPVQITKNEKTFVYPVRCIKDADE